VVLRQINAQILWQLMIILDFGPCFAVVDRGLPVENINSYRQILAKNWNPGVNQASWSDHLDRSVFFLRIFDNL
jgi:hypothetical protein